MHARRVDRNAAACSAVGSSFTCTTSFTRATVPNACSRQAPGSGQHHLPAGVPFLAAPGRRGTAERIPPCPNGRGSCDSFAER
ncbi:hypothetical protein FXN61_07555 [Lentzea sp. PSKA42]|uniref:Uncharacterized protein n=1 Tax=Lentzea indica TaxID=2604800 RepID=A0ABX1FCR4_9PSEU|nr:hypothetical protein [Lentzea indica]